MISKDFPPVPEMLLRELKKAFPNTLPSSDVSIEVIRKLQGEQRVIAYLQAQFFKQNPDFKE